MVIGPQIVRKYWGANDWKIRCAFARYHEGEHAKAK